MNKLMKIRGLLSVLTLTSVGIYLGGLDKLPEYNYIIDYIFRPIWGITLLYNTLFLTYYHD